MATSSIRRRDLILMPFADKPQVGGLTKFTDVDDGTREVPVNMNFTDEGYLSRDTGVTTFADTGSSLIRRLIKYKKKSGTTYKLRLDGQKLLKYDSVSNTYVPLQTESAALAGTAATTAPTAGTGTLTTNATAVVGVGTNFTGELTANVSFIIVNGVSRLVTAIADATHATIDAAFDVDITTASAFTISAQLITGTGTAFNTDLIVGQVIRVGPSATYVVRSITSATVLVVEKAPAATASGLSYYKDSEYLFDTTAKMGYVEYLDTLYLGNGVDLFATFDGTQLKFVRALPRGNVYEIYKDRLFVSGTVREPLSTYYSDPAAPTTFQVSSVFQLVGTDKVTGLITYYSSLIIFKEKSIHKMTFTYDPIAVAFLPEFEVVNRNYGCSSIRGYTWVENNVWFFTGSEVRAVGFKDQQIGVLGVDNSILSNDIKETMKLITAGMEDDVVVFYSARKFYLSLALSSSTYNNTIFVAHTLYGNKWTKYVNRIKSSVSDFMVDNDIIYTASGNVNGVMYTWTSSYNDNDADYEYYVTFRKYVDKDFASRKTYRYLDFQFKNLEASAAVYIYSDDFDVRNTATAPIYIGTQLENEDNALGEVDFGEQLLGDAFGEDVDAASFINRRISFLKKGQTLQWRIGGVTKNQSFTLAQMILYAFTHPRKQYSPGAITSIN